LCATRPTWSRSERSGERFSEIPLKAEASSAMAQLGGQRVQFPGIFSINALTNYKPKDKPGNAVFHRL
jgi:hypothetical protein